MEPENTTSNCLLNTQKTVIDDIFDFDEKSTV
jgi:hypothetical protein